MEQTNVKNQKIDLMVMVDNIIREVKRLWLLGLALVVVCAGILSVNSYHSYTPVYEASASFTVRVANPLYGDVYTYNTATAEQMAKTFPYILTSNVLRQRVTSYLGVDFIPQVTADVLESSNIFTLSVRDADPQRAYDVLHAVIECYPQVSDLVIGPTQLVLLDETGVPSQPVSPFSLARSIQRGALIGLAIWVVIVLILSTTRSTIHNEEELKKVLNLPCIGHLPMVRVSGKPQCPLVHQIKQNSGFEEAVRLLELRVEKEMAAQNSKVLLLSSAIPGEGKTTVSANLAISMALKGFNVLLIDCDLRNPSVARALGEKPGAGIDGFLVGKQTAQGLVRKTRIENLSIISGGTGKVENTTELLTGKRIQLLINAVRKIYDLVILDTPPCSLLTDASELAEIADCGLMVIRHDFASQDLIVDGVQSLTEGGLPMLGCVLNGIQSGLSSSYGYVGYGYGYGYSYGSRYGYGSSYGSKSD